MLKDQIAKRMRVFAGPNGSGKSTIIKEITKQVRTGTYINADDIEQLAKTSKFINLGNYNLQSSEEHFLKYLKSSTLLAKARSEGLDVDLSLIDNVIRIGKNTNSYEAALIADYLRMLIITNGDLLLKQ
jgi:uridine kinase